AKEAVHGAVRHGQAEVVHRELAAAEALGQPAGGDGQRRGRDLVSGLGTRGPAQLGLAASVLRTARLRTARLRPARLRTARLRPARLGLIGGRTETDLVWLEGVRRAHLRAAASA